jgi:hypothetical protein
MEHMTRDNFSPMVVLARLKDGPYPTKAEVERLLEEACHALARERETKRQFLDQLSNMQKTLSR